MRSGKGKHRDVEAADRALQALNLRKAGATYEAIARQLQYSSRSAVYTAIQRELQRTIQEPADELRQLEVERLNDLYRAMIPHALSGDKDSTWYVDRCLKIMERRAALLGLDAPKMDASAVQQPVMRRYILEPRTP